MRKFILLLITVTLLFSAASLAVFGSLPLDYAAQAPMYQLLAILAGSMALAAFIFGAVTGDNSWVDRLWSVAPAIFAWIFWLRGTRTLASLAASLLVTLWAARLTANFARRGGYTGREDYRWSILRQRIPHPLLWQLFNASFICLGQFTVIALFSSPLVKIASGSAPRYPGLFQVAFLAALACIGIEALADQQRWHFHERKAGAEAAGLASDDETRRGFISSGLFRFSRHPNYFGELGFWYCVYLLGAAVSGSFLDLSLAGPLALSALFIGSISFTESISASKYPDYADYRKKTSVLVPFFPFRRG